MTLSEKSLRFSKKNENLNAIQKEEQIRGS